MCQDRLCWTAFTHISRFQIHFLETKSHTKSHTALTLINVGRPQRCARDERKHACTHKHTCRTQSAKRYIFNSALPILVREFQLASIATASIRSRIKLMCWVVFCSLSRSQIELNIYTIIQIFTKFSYIKLTKRYFNVNHVILKPSSSILLAIISIETAIFSAMRVEYEFF